MSLFWGYMWLPLWHCHPSCGREAEFLDAPESVPRRKRSVSEVLKLPSCVSTVDLRKVLTDFKIALDWEVTGIWLCGLATQKTWGLSLNLPSYVNLGWSLIFENVHFLLCKRKELAFGYTRILSELSNTMLNHAQSWFHSLIEILVNLRLLCGSWSSPLTVKVNVNTSGSFD